MKTGDQKKRRTGTKQNDLLGSALGALKWSYIGTFVQAFSQILIGILLARLLGPEPYGIVALAWLVIGLGNLFADFGFGAALIQRKEITDRDIRYVFALQTGLGLFLTLSMVLVAPALAYFFETPNLEKIFRAMGLIFFIQALGQTSASLLRRHLDFRSLQVNNVLSYLLAFLGLGIPLAYAGFGVWSLVLAQITQRILITILNYAKIRHPVLPCRRYRSSRGFYTFGGKVILTNCSNWIISNMESLFIGKIFGTPILGLYNRVYFLVMTPLNNTVTVLQHVLFPSFARAQDDSQQLTKGYLAAFAIVSLFTFPTFITIAFIPQTVIEGLYGPKWLRAIPLLLPLALAVPFQALMSLSGPMLLGKGRVEKELKVQSAVAFLYLIILLVLTRISILAVVWGVLAIYFLRFVLMTAMALGLLKVTWRILVKLFYGPLILSFALTSSIVILDWILKRYGFTAPLRLAIEGIFGVTGMLTCLFFLPKMFFAPVTRTTLKRIAISLPGPFASFFLRRIG